MIVIDDPATWPAELVQALEAEEVAENLRRAQYVEDLEQIACIAAIRGLVDDLVEKHGVAGFHCSREPFPGCFAERGLRVLDMEEHQRELLELLAPDLGPELTDRARRVLADFAASDQRPIRDGRLWFCFSRNVVDEPAAEKLFRFVGGEAVYWWLWRDPDIGPVLGSKGTPVVVEAHLFPSEMRPGVGQLGLGASLLSHYATQRVNPEFVLWEVETYVCDPMPPDRIVAVHPLDEFRARWGARSGD